VSLLIYGAAGFTGRLIVEEAVARGLRPILAGRDAARVVPLAQRYGLPHRTFALTDAAQGLAGVRVVLHAAGPFRDTWAPMVDACVAVGAHYLDLSGEVDSLHGVSGRDEAARERGVMLMPGVGFDVVPSDCLAAMVAAKLGAVARLRVAISGLELVSRGSLRTLAAAAHEAVVRRAGVLHRVPVASLRRRFDFGHGPRDATLVAWGDVVTARYSTGAPDIEAYWEETAALAWMLAARRVAPWLAAPAVAEASLGFAATWVPEGPSPAERAARRAVVVVEAEDARGRVARGRIESPEAYTLSAISAVAVARRALEGDVEEGFQTPSRVYGAGFAATLPGVVVAGVEGPRG
jgi:short subunit dehydrogenase-like uncharacterized protein